METRSTSLIEKSILVSLFMFLTLGIVLAHIDHDFFKDQFVVEDGLIETLTVIALSINCLVYINRIFSHKLENGLPFFFIMCFSALVFFFAAGEEISWGQRIFNIESSAFFLEHNAQQETNFHNLIVNDTKINKLVFSKILMLFALTYILLFPWLYSKKPNFRSFIDRLGIPIAQKYQILAFVIFFIMTELTFSSKKGELLEFFGTFLLLLIITYPVNKNVFSRKPVSST